MKSEFVDSRQASAYLIIGEHAKPRGFSPVSFLSRT